MRLCWITSREFGTTERPRTGARMFLFVLLAMVAIGGTAGCRYAVRSNTSARITDAEAAVAAVNDPITRAETRRETIVQAVDRARGAADSSPRVTEPLTTAKVAADGQKDDLAEARRATASAMASLANAERTAAEEQERFEHLRDQWYVVWGLRIERFIWFITIAWISAGIGGAVLTIIGANAGGGMIFNLGRLILGLIPGAKLFSWAPNAWGKVVT